MRALMQHAFSRAADFELHNRVYAFLHRIAHIYIYIQSDDICCVFIPAFLYFATLFQVH